MALNPRKTKIVLAVGLVAGLITAGIVILALYLSRPRPLGPGPSAAVELSSLKSLPYLSQSTADADLSRVGVTTYDRARAHDGYNLFTNNQDFVLLMNMQGRVVHNWHLPGMRHCEYAELLRNGRLLVICEGQAVIKLDWSSQPLFRGEGKVNHDLAILPDGSFLVPTRDAPRPHRDFPHVIFDTLVHISLAGKIVGKWSFFQHLSELQAHHPLLKLDQPRDQEGFGEQRPVYEYYHLNTVEILPDTPLGRQDKRFQRGNLMLCLRNAGLIIILDRATRQVVWSWGPQDLDFPHMPTMLLNGNLLIFDNGTHRKYSRVIEINPVTKKIVWEYKGTPPESFYSKWRGSNQRLANGNTLICDSESGRAFEVTNDKRIVWEFWNPDIRGGKRTLIYRMMRYPKSIIDPFLNVAKKTSKEPSKASSKEPSKEPSKETTK